MFQTDQAGSYEVALSNERIHKDNSRTFEKTSGIPFGFPVGILDDEAELAMPVYGEIRDHIIERDRAQEAAKLGIPTIPIEEDEQEAAQVRKEILDLDAWEHLNYWECNDPKRSNQRVAVSIWRNAVTNERKHMIDRIHHGHRESYDFLIDSLDRWGRYHDHSAEKKANRKLRKLLQPAQLRQLDLTSCFVEGETKSGVMYLLRKGRPTIAMRRRVVGKRYGINFLAALCLHPQGYFKNTFAGTMVPSDELLTHLMYIRTDEHTFWKKANHHYLDQTQSGF